MEIEITSTCATKEYVDYFINSVERIEPEIKELLLSKKIKFVLCDSMSDMRTLEEMKDINSRYEYDLKVENVARGNLSNDDNTIAIFAINTKLEYIEAILYHEIGHFLDCYKSFENVKTIYDMQLSTTDFFKDAYFSDFLDNWHLIRSDLNPRLKHFVQNSTPEKITQYAISETFAELFRYNCKKVNDTKNVELYFKSAKDAQIHLLKKEYGLKF